jgi:ABC-type amino acid transport substrate-binding protein
LPRDPRRSLERARGGSLRVAVSEHAPWVVKNGNEPRGVEADLVRSFSVHIGAHTEWSWGMVDAQFDALERFELDLVIGGLVEDSPWKPRLGFTRPYYEERIVVGVPEPAAEPEDLDGLAIGCEPGTIAAHYLRKRDARPVSIAEARRNGSPVAAPEWQVRAWGLRPTRHTLLEQGHVMAVAPGENALLVALERFLLVQTDIPQRLEREAAAWCRARHASCRRSNASRCGAPSGSSGSRCSSCSRSASPWA